ncbi:TPA: hypothetical protein RQL16_002346 [Vibrio vulnificus]|nr:hypothetical protein [Vibrio vulnificus]HDY8218508.1 hypothetical protein [Vibrio vulnificus]
MAKKLCLVLGNGFTIDLINSAKKNDCIDVLNLFSKGAELPWPGSQEAGFLSFKHCPNLWNLGARPNMDKDEAMLMLEKIITCINVHVLKSQPRMLDGENKPNDIYLNAYHELNSYLRALFSYYNHLIDDQELKEATQNWPWIQFLKRASESQEYESISIITYNYDIWLERLLLSNDISFTIPMVKGGEFGQNSKITIIKPHGSISYYHDIQSKADYSIGYQKPIPGDATTDTFTVDHKVPNSKCLVSALIPPAGDTERMKQSWSGQMRVSAAGKLRTLQDGDELMICGISYWHVDRAEIDELLTSCSSKVGVYMFNPYPNYSMDAVLTSLFSNYVYYSDASVLNTRLV